MVGALRNPAYAAAQARGSVVFRPIRDWLGDSARHRLQIIDSRGQTPDGTTGGGAGDSNFTNADSRIACRNGPVAASNLRLVFSNYDISSGKEVAAANAITVRAALEFWSGSSGTYVTQGVTFNGADSVALGTRAGLVISDPIGVTVDAGRLFFVRANAQVASGEVFPAPGLNHGGSVLASDPSSGNGGNMIRNTSATAVFDTSSFAGSAVRGFCHLGVLGVVAGYCPSVVIYGDSIAFGSGDSVSTAMLYGNTSGFVSRGLRLSDDRLIPHACMAVSGTTMGHLGTNAALCGIDNPRRWGMLDYATHAVFNYGRNDISSGSSLAALQGYAVLAWGRAKARGVKVAQCKIMPSTTSTDSWATPGNQTVTTGFGIGGIRDQFNAWISTKLADGTIDYVIDPNPYVEDQINLSKWVTSPSPVTSDGVHPNTAGHQAASAAVRVWAEQIALGA